MNKLLRILISGLTMILLGMIIGFQLTGRKGELAGSYEQPGLGKLAELIQFIEVNYVDDPSGQQMIEDAIYGIMNGLDPHSFYIPASQSTAMEEQLEGGFDGIGVVFNLVEDTIYIERPLAESPSINLGIRSADRIITVDGENVAGIGITREQVLERLKGRSGTAVSLEILRRGTPDLLRFDVTRARIPVNSVEFSYMIRPGIGYIHLSRFTEHTYEEFREALLELKGQDMQSLVLDLRGNPGGYMSKANKIADEFLESGELIVSTKGRNSSTMQSYHATSSIGAFEQGALLILIDYNSASASEIVAGAVQDHDRGLIVGVRSFGKGLVQVPRKFEDNSAIRLVISKYYTPSGRCIQKPYDQGEAAYEADILNRFESGELFHEQNVSIPDSLLYQTDAGRPVYGGGGIYPDAFVPIDTTANSQYLSELLAQDLFRLFAFRYVDRNPPILREIETSERYLESFSISPSLIGAFTRFAESKGVPFDEIGYATSAEVIRTQLKAFIGRHLFGNDVAYYPVLHQRDNQLQQALDLLPVAAELEGSGEVNLALRRTSPLPMD